MDRRVGALAILLGLAAAAYPSFAAPPGPPQERSYTLTVTAVSCPGFGVERDGVCLAYNGQIPGPTIDINLGDSLVITLVNDIPSTISAATSDPDIIAHLSGAAVSWHVHGTALAANMDGVAAHAGTQMIESVADAGASYTYRVRAAFAGSWHYHDHVLGLDGSEGVARGLYGGFVVRQGAQPRSDVLDLHMLDAGANGGRGFSKTVSDADDIEVLVVGLENTFWPLQLRSPSNTVLANLTIGPGMSDRLRLDADDTTVGTYRIRAGALTVATIEVTP